MFKSDFINNTAKSCGGAIFFYNKTNYNTFQGNYINNRANGLINKSNGNGGAINFKDTSKNSIFNCDFISNTVRLYGGAVNYRETPYKCPSIHAWRHLRARKPAQSVPGARPSAGNHLPKGSDSSGTTESVTSSLSTFSRRLPPGPYLRQGWTGGQ